MLYTVFSNYIMAHAHYQVTLKTKPCLATMATAYKTKSCQVIYKPKNTYVIICVIISIRPQSFGSGVVFKSLWPLHVIIFLWQLWIAVRGSTTNIKRTAQQLTDHWKPSGTFTGQNKHWPQVRAKGLILNSHQMILPFLNWDKNISFLIC